MEQGSDVALLSQATVSETFKETELFGHEADAFTVATRRYQERFERAALLPIPQRLPAVFFKKVLSSLAKLMG